MDDLERISRFVHLGRFEPLPRFIRSRAGNRFDCEVCKHPIKLGADQMTDRDNFMHGHYHYDCFLTQEESLRKG